MNLVKYKNFPENQYFKVEQPKKMVVLHHTVSGEGVNGDINWWMQTPERIATPYIIERDGKITEVFDPKYWGHHLGLRQANLNAVKSTVTNERLNQLSIAIELDSWGILTKKGDKFYSANGKEVPKENVAVLDKPYRGSLYYEKYTEKQIAALRELLLHLKDRFGIKLYYFEEMFEVSQKALKGYHGIWSHTSYRSDKSDVFPQKELVEMLKSIKEN